MVDHAAGENKKILTFPNGGQELGKKKDGMTTYDTQSISANAGEKLLLKVMATKKGGKFKPATIARLLFYRGLEAFLKDKNLDTEKSQDELFELLTKYVESDSDMRVLKRVMEKHLPTEEDRKETKQRKTS